LRPALHYLGWLLGIARPETQTTDAERACLARHAQGRRRVVEIGVWHGVTTSWLKRSMDGAGELSAVDPYHAGRLRFSMQERIAHREVDRVQGGRVNWIKATGREAAAGHGTVEFIFIDGDHSEEGLLGDWNAWSGLVEPGGIVALHDSRSSTDRCIDDAGSVKVTNDVILRDPRFDLVETVDSLTVVRRRADV
jgi:predicted O-methyltransferase YrrM